MEIRTDDVIVRFDKSTEKTAKDVVSLYPAIRTELVKAIGWRIDFRPVVIISRGREIFERMSAGDLVIAFALPEENIILLDNSKISPQPLVLRSVMKHESCHLLLHAHVAEENLPRWLDEGVCQWASGGFAEILSENKDILAGASVSGKLTSMRELSTFPKDGQGLLLAYEESKSLIEYVVSEYGTSGLLRILGSLKGGEATETAFKKSLGVTVSELENQWADNLRRKYTRFYYISRRIYLILFSVAALITIYGFIKMMQRKRSYVDEEND
ncbi:MAG: hypothetical protein AB1390_04795 [Nitrospirota bacterium]